MMPTIRVDDEVWGWLKEHAQPFEDTPNSVLRRIAGLETGKPAPETPRRLRRVEREVGSKTPQNAYRVPILKILLRHGGRADRNTVLRELERAMAGRLTDHDRRDIKSGSIRWQKSAEWEASTMRQQGLLLPQNGSPWGVWCLSDEGERLARGA